MESLIRYCRFRLCFIKCGAARRAHRSAYPRFAAGRYAVGSVGAGLCCGGSDLRLTSWTP